MVHQVVVCLLSVSTLFSWFNLVEKVVETPIQLWMVRTVLQSCTLIDLAIKLNLRHKVMTLFLLSWNTLGSQWGVLFSTRVDESQGYLDLMCTTRPKCFNQGSNLIGCHGYMWDSNYDVAGLTG